MHPKIAVMMLLIVAAFWSGSLIIPNANMPLWTLAIPPLFSWSALGYALFAIIIPILRSS